jgi:Malate:quinone oxidoreductase (Mqo)
LWGQANPTPYVKDAFHEYVVAGNANAVNPAKRGTKAAARYLLNVPARGSKVVRLRLSNKPGTDPFANFDKILAERQADADEFYDRVTPKNLSEDERRVHRQALAGMLWSKQYYYFDVDRWLLEHDAHPVLGSKKWRSRNAECDVISMPDKWEYPWYAAFLELGRGIAAPIPPSRTSHEFCPRSRSPEFPEETFCGPFDPSSLITGWSIRRTKSRSKNGIPLVIEGRDPDDVVAATRIATRTDVDYGELTQDLLDRLNRFYMESGVVIRCAFLILIPCLSLYLLTLSSSSR